MNHPLHKLTQHHHFADGDAYDRHAGRVSGGVYRRVADDVAAAAPARGTVADAGCGSGRLAVDLARRRPDLRVHGVDLEERLTPARRASTLLRRFTKSAADRHEFPTRHRCPTRSR